MRLRVPAGAGDAAVAGEPEVGIRHFCGPRSGIKSLPHTTDELVHLGKVSLDAIDVLGDLQQSPAEHLPPYLRVI